MSLLVDAPARICIPLLGDAAAGLAPSRSARGRQRAKASGTDSASKARMQYRSVMPAR